MTLGEKILQLRNDRGLSQGDLAEQLNISRQSVSKWELDASVPDLDKLVAMSEFFGVTLDELVKGETVERSAPPRPEPEQRPAEPPAPPAQIGGTQRTIGFILLALGLFTAVLGIGSNPAFLILAAYPLACGVICLTVRKHAGLVIGWGSYWLIAELMPPITSVSFQTVFNSYYYSNGMWGHLLIACGLWAALIALVVCTVPRTPLRGHTLLVLGWFVYFYTRGDIWFVFDKRYSNAFQGHWPGAVVALVLLPLLLFFTGRLIYRHFKK